MTCRFVLPLSATLQVLLGEATLVNQRVAVTRLRKLGFSPDLAANGVEALNALEKRLMPLLSAGLLRADKQEG